MKNVQTNIRLPTDIKDWLQSKAKEDGRTKGEVLARILRPLMKAVPPIEFPVKSIEAHLESFTGDTRLQQSLIPKIDKAEGFDEFWQAYPKKKAKADALKAWKKNDCYIMRGEIIHDVINRSKNDPSWSDKQFVPNGATYLSGKRWEDEITEQDNRPKFEQQGDALREKMFGKKGETYDH